MLVVGRGDRVLLREVLGRRSLEPAVEPMTADTVFDLASLTKLVATATAVMRLVEDGAVRLDDAVAEHLPEFGANGKEGVTVEHLLLHRGGLVPDNPLADYEDTPELAWERICALPLVAPPGEAFVYTDVGYVVLGELVRAVDGRGLDAFCTDELFAPLAMGDTTFRPDPARCAPTERRGGRVLRGEVHDPRAAALGGVAGHAGLFSTADDLARWCRMVLAGGALEGVRVLRPETVAEMTRPRWLPDRTGGRALGFDVDTQFSSARGSVFPRGASTGHTGFTGTSLWIDPRSESYVILLTNRVHPDGAGSVVELRHAVATAVGRALAGPVGETETGPAVRTGADVLAREGCARLAGLRVGLLCNAASRTAAGERTADVLARAEGVELGALLTPEHGLQGDREGDVADAFDGPTGVAVHSLYGATRRPPADLLAELDALVVDLPDVGTRFYTYATTLGYAMEEAAAHGVAVVVLDRPNPITGTRVAGPCADPARFSFIAYRPLPVVHGMTIGELARLYAGHYGVACELEVVACEGWRRDMWWEDTGLPWIPPSPNLRNPTQAVLYPAIGLLEGANLSVGRGTDEPFEKLGAPWIDGVRLAAELRALDLAGLAFAPIEFTPEAGPFAGERCGGVQVTLVDRERLRPVEAGLAIGATLLRLYPDDFDAPGMDARMLNARTWEAWMRGADPDELRRGWTAELESFLAIREGALLYE